jgi:hypothetical protein
MLVRNATRGEIGWSGCPGDGKAMAGDENNRSNGPAAPKDESGRHSNDQLNEVGKQGLKEEPADKDLNPASGKESSLEADQPDELGNSIMEYARRVMGLGFRVLIDRLFLESSNGSINHLKMFFGMLGIREPDKQMAGPPEGRAGFFSQLLHNEAAKMDVVVSRPGEVKTATTREAEIVPFPGEGEEVPPKPSEPL